MNSITDGFYFTAFSSMLQYTISKGIELHATNIMSCSDQKTLKRVFGEHVCR